MSLSGIIHVHHSHSFTRLKIYHHIYFINLIKFLAFDINNLLMFLVRNESSPLGISSVAVALDFQVFLAQAIRLKKSNSNLKLKDVVVVTAQNEKPTKCRNGMLSQSGASIFAARPIRSE